MTDWDAENNALNSEAQDGITYDGSDEQESSAAVEETEDGENDAEAAYAAGLTVVMLRRSRIGFGINMSDAGVVVSLRKSCDEDAEDLLGREVVKVNGLAVAGKGEISLALQGCTALGEVGFGFDPTKELQPTEEQEEEEEEEEEPLPPPAAEPEVETEEALVDPSESAASIDPLQRETALMDAAVKKAEQEHRQQRQQQQEQQQEHHHHQQQQEEDQRAASAAEEEEREEQELGAASAIAVAAVAEEEAAVEEAPEIAAAEAEAAAAAALTAAETAAETSEQERLVEKEAQQDFEVVCVKVVKCTNVIGADKGGRSSDPYVQLYLDEAQKQQTKRLDKTLNPVFDEECSFVLTSDSKQLRVKVNDFDRGSKDDFLGQVVVNMAELIAQGSKKLGPKTFALGDADDQMSKSEKKLVEKRTAGGDAEPYGTIEMEFTFMTASTDERVVSLTRTEVVHGSARDYIDYTFEVTGTDAGNEIFTCRFSHAKSVHEQLVMEGLLDRLAGSDLY